MSFKLEPTYKISFKYRRVLVPFDGSGPSVQALELALDWSQRYGSKITVLYAFPKNAPREHVENVLRSAERIAESKTIQVHVKGVEYDPLKESPSSTILKEANEAGYDAIIVGARGTSTYEDLVLGSVALSLLHNAYATVVIVR